MAKTVIVKIEGSLVTTVLPAPSQLAVSLFAEAIEARSAELALEEEFKDRFPDCETGAMPPFGNLYNMPVFADESFAPHKEMTFKAGSHRELVRLAWKDFDRLVKHKVTNLPQTIGQLQQACSGRGVARNVYWRGQQAPGVASIQLDGRLFRSGRTCGGKVFLKFNAPVELAE